MGKKNNVDKKSLPFVSICTPTFNRRPFWEYTIKCFAHQNYPKDRMEWIIIDDGSDKIKDLVCDISQVKYYEYDVKMPLGKKRNLMHEKSKGDIIVYMDDDDYYPPERVSHAVNMLMTHPSALCAGSSEIYIWFKHINKMFQFGPYGPNHATAGTFAFKRELLKDHRYDDNAALAEEKAFLKNYSVPFVQLEPKKTILVFSHIHNTFDKKKLLEHGENDYQKTSQRSVDEFIKSEDMKEFYMEKIEGLLKNYEPGDPSNKPDVLKQIKEIERERKNMALQDNREQGGRIVLNQDGKQIVLNNEQIVQIIQSQQEQLQKFGKMLEEKDRIISNLESQLDIELIQSLQEQLQKFGKMLEEKDRIISNLESQLDIEIVQSQQEQLQTLVRTLEDKDRIITSFESQVDAYKVMNEKYSSIIVSLQKTMR